MPFSFPLLAQDAALSLDLMPDLTAVLTELWLCAMVVVLLIVDLVRGKGPSTLFPWLSLGGIGVAIVLVLTGGDASVGYDGFPALTIDGLARIFKLIFLATGALTVLFIARSREPYGNEGELHVILFGALAGMCYLASATDVISFYLAFETVSYTGFLMAGYRLYSSKSAEAAGKFVIFGGVSSAVMLFGLSLIYGYVGSLEFAEIAAALNKVDPESALIVGEPALIVGAVFVFGGFAFKAAAFPFQFWCPDVYEGSPAPIAGFLAVASKAAVFAVGLRALLLITLPEKLPNDLIAGVMPASERLTDLLNASSGTFLHNLLIVAAVGTMTWGNLAALKQDNVQRMLAYSSIAHAGYLLMTAVVIWKGAVAATGAVIFYFLIYLCMNLGAFFIVTLMRRDSGSAELSALRGAASRQPVLAICFAIMLFSLTGLPPTAGFVGKLQLFAPVIEGGYYWLAVIGLLNGAISLYYYARPLKEMFLADVDEGLKPAFKPAGVDLAVVVALTVPLVFFGLFGWDGVTDMARNAVAMVK